MKRALALVALILTGCGKVMADERGVFKTYESYRSEDKIKVGFVSGAPNTGFVEHADFKIDADEIPGGIENFKRDELLDCHVERRRDPVKENPMEPEITDCERVEG